MPRRRRPSFAAKPPLYRESAREGACRDGRGPRDQRRVSAPPKWREDLGVVRLSRRRPIFRRKGRAARGNLRRRRSTALSIGNGASAPVGTRGPRVRVCTERWVLENAWAARAFQAFTGRHGGRPSKPQRAAARQRPSNPCWRGMLRRRPLVCGEAAFVSRKRRLRARYPTRCR
jgi:hypothetical protein